MSKILQRIYDPKNFIGSTVHIVENGLLYMNLVIEKVTTSSIHTPEKSFDRNNAEIYLSKKFVPEYEIGDTVRVIGLHGKTLTTPVKGIIMDVDHDQGGGTNIYLVIPDTTSEIREIKREHNEGASKEYTEGIACLDGLWE